MTWPYDLIPGPPLLIAHEARTANPAPPFDTGAVSIEDAITEALQWHYTVRLEHTWALQDELRFDVIFNEPVPPEMGQTAVTAGHLMEHFFVTLPDEPEAMRLSGRGQSGGPPSQWPVVTVQNQVWSPRSDSPADRVLLGDEEWWQANHCFENVDDPSTFFSQMALAWLNLDWRQKQTANLSAYAKRKVTRVAPGEPDQESIYQTPPVRFTHPVIPLIRIMQIRPLATAATLAQTLQQIFKAIAPTGQGRDCHLRVALQYEHQVAGADFRSIIPVMLSDHFAFRPDSVPAIASGMAQQAAAWYKATTPSTAGAVLTLGLTLFGTVGHEQIPLVQINAIPILGVPKEPEWWDGPPTPVTGLPTTKNL
jgi:hypothetical protein